MSKAYVWYKLGDYSPSRVEVQDGAIVDDLKRAIKKEWPELNGVAAARLKAFAAGADLNSTTSELKSYDLIPTDTTGPNPLVVVVAPASQQEVGRSQFQNENGIPDHFAPILLNLAVKNMAIGWEKISENRTNVDSVTAKEKSIKFYGLDNERHCQVLGPGTKHVVNAHLWPHNNMENLPLISLAATDIDNPKNVLRLHSDIEHKFDRFQLTFVPSGNDFFLKVLDPSIKNITLKDTTVTFEEIDGRPLLFPSGYLPWRRILGTHSILAHRKAREKGHLQDDQLTAAECSANELMEFSLDAEAMERIKMLF